MNNIITLVDSYKLGHYKMLPKGTQAVYSYFESRNGAKYPETVFFGLQYLLKKYLEGKVVTKEKIDQAEKLVNAHLGPGMFNREGWEYILKTYDGRLPVMIKAVPEGMPVTTGNVLMTVTNTDDRCYWLTNYLETLLTHVWYSSTVATQSREARKMFLKYAEETAMDSKHVAFQLHDFGFRGVSSVESAGLGGAGHLINFMGTDTIAAMELIMDYYNTTEIPAYSVPATEHSIMTSLGKEGEEALLKQLLDEYPKGILSIVIDSYDYREFIKLAGTKFKEQILAREGKVVFRPDSGDPVKVSMEVMRLLGLYFGYTYNAKSYQVLNPKVGMLWGDGIDVKGMEDILIAFVEYGWSTENIVFGMGGGLLQKVNRDIQRFAFKCSAQKRNNQWIDVWKDPVDKSKVSKKGRLMLLKNTEGKFYTENLRDQVRPDHLEMVFFNGAITKEYTFTQIRENAK